MAALSPLIARVAGGVQLPTVDLDYMVYQLKYDSVHGKCKYDLEVRDGEGCASRATMSPPFVTRCPRGSRRQAHGEWQARCCVQRTEPEGHPVGQRGR